MNESINQSINQISAVMSEATQSVCVCGRGIAFFSWEVLRQVRDVLTQLSCIL